MRTRSRGAPSGAGPAAGAGLAGVAFIVCANAGRIDVFGAVVASAVVAGASGKGAIERPASDSGLCSGAESGSDRGFE